MNQQSLQDKVTSRYSVREILRNNPTGFYVFPVPDEHSNWRDEQAAWANSAVLFDQSYHMTDLFISGPDTIRLLSETSINNYDNFLPLAAAQYVACNSRGQLIGDAIVFCLRDGKANVVTKPPAANWLTFMAASGDYDVEIVRDERVLDGDGQRRNYRFQIQGPNANAILEKLNGGPLPETRFFGMCEFSIAGYPVTALRHGMAGAPGMEFWGPYEQRATVRQAIIDVGEEFGLKLGGGRTYSTAGPQSGWVGSVLPAIYDGDELQAYREWLPADGYEGMLSIGGSLLPPEIDGYYLDPWDVGYERLIHWDHEFVGRDALLTKRTHDHRRKIWLRWNPEDVQEVFASYYRDGERCKFLEMPAAHYATIPYDRVTIDDREIGISVYAAYTVNANSWFSIGIVDEDAVHFGKSVSITWGEPEGLTGKLTVEQHVQTDIRATMSQTALG